MNGLDLLLVLLAVMAVVGGWRLGFLRRFATWVGAAVGIWLAIVILPDVVSWTGIDSDLGILTAAIALLVLLASVGQGLGAVVGARLHTGVVDGPTIRRVDALGGAAIGVVAVCALAWLVVPVMADTAGWPAASARGSTVARFIDEHLPDPPRQITELERQLAGGEFPRLFAGLRSAPEVPPPPAGSPVDAAMLERVAHSAVRLSSTACGRIQSGSGFVVAPNLVVTNAHVVAAADEVELETATGDTASGAVVAFDPEKDLALVAAAMDQPALPVAEPSVGDRGLVLGFPGGGPFEPSPFEVGQQMTATGFDIYDRQLVRRDLLALASSLEPGDSGSAVLRDDGSVIGVAVAIAPDRAGVAYALDADELQGLLAEVGGRTLTARVDTGPCTR